MRPRPRCPICVSKRWRKDPTSGLIVCSEGHVFEVRLFACAGNPDIYKPSAELQE